MREFGMGTLPDLVTLEGIIGCLATRWVAEVSMARLLQGQISGSGSERPLMIQRLLPGFCFSGQDIFQSSQAHDGACSTNISGDLNVLYMNYKDISNCYTIDKS